MRESSVRIETRTLQVVVAIGSLVPIAAGGTGVILGPGFFGGHAVASADLDGHFRYLSGLLLGIGLAYLSAVPRIEKRRQRFLLLAGLVVLGGLGRLLSILLRGAPSHSMIFALIMELAVTPAITLWQLSIAR
ncbi:MAG: DUF4345 domain-containing protein [Stellaceae bacterium]